MRLNPNASVFAPNKYTKARMNIKKEIFAKMNTRNESIQIVRKINALLELPTNKEFANAVGMKMNSLFNISKSEKRKLKERRNKHIKKIKTLTKKVNELTKEYDRLNILRKLPSHNAFFTALTRVASPGSRSRSRQPPRSRCGA